MSWWWAAPLVVGTLGAGALGVLARRLAGEAAHAARAAEGLAATVAGVREARRAVGFDLGRYHPTETGPAPQ